MTTTADAETSPTNDQPNVNNEEVYRQAELDLKNLLDILVPPNSINIVDIFGNEYELPSSCSARAQIKIIKEFDKLKALPSVTEALGGGVAIGDATDLIKIIAQVAGDPAVMEGIAKAFETAHPGAYAKAKKSAKENSVKFSDAADLFAVEELAGAVIPLFIRLVKKGAQAMQTLSRATTVAAT